MKWTPGKIVLGTLVVYGGWKMVKSMRPALAAPEGNRALRAPNPQQNFQPPRLPQPQPQALTPGRQLGVAPVVDWRERGTPETIRGAADDVLEEGTPIRSNLELSHATAARIWPGVSVERAALQAVAQELRSYIRWPEAPDTHEMHEACVRVRARAPAAIQLCLLNATERVDMEATLTQLATRVFPEIPWPPTETSPDWVRVSWQKLREQLAAEVESRGLSRQPGDQTVAMSLVEEPEPADPEGEVATEVDDDDDESESAEA